jgi:hypothetical protein
MRTHRPQWFRSISRHPWRTRANPDPEFFLVIGLRAVSLASRADGDEGRREFGRGGGQAEQMLRPHGTGVDSRRATFTWVKPPPSRVQGFTRQRGHPDRDLRGRHICAIAASCHLATVRGSRWQIAAGHDLPLLDQHFPRWAARSPGPVVRYPENAAQGGPKTRTSSSRTRTRSSPTSVVPLVSRPSTDCGEPYQ